MKSLTKREYHSYVTDTANDSSDHGKKCWSFVRASNLEALESKAKPTASSFKINDISVTDPTVIANSFNDDFFSSNFTISDEPDIVDTWCEGHQGAPHLIGIQTNSYEVLKIIKFMRLSMRINVVRPAPSYTIHGKSLSVVQNYKYLGIMISSNLKWGIM